MILGIGSDLCDIRRIERSLERFGERFTAPHLHRGRARRAATGGRPRAPSYAKRFAAKEACAKALGTGMRRGRVLARHGGGEPARRAADHGLTGGALERLRAMTPAGHEAVVHVSLTDDPPLAQAFVIIEARPI